MSRIGKQPIPIPDGVTVTVQNGTVHVKGAKGELKVQPHRRMKIAVENNEVRVERGDDEKFSKSLHGLTRSLIANMIEGVSEGFEKKLEIIGVGYRANVQGKKLALSLGYSHPVEMEAPEGITFEIDKEKKNILIVSGFDKQLVGQVAANIRAKRPPEPYKGKGVKYLEEHIQRKAGKAAAAAAGGSGA